MQDIHVQRYAGSTWSGSVTPENREWIVFVAANGEATFWRRVEVIDEVGKRTHVYIDAELTTRTTATGTMPAAPTMMSAARLDYTVVPGVDESLGPVGNETRPSGFFARLNHRQIGAFGTTEHEAIAGLLNYVAMLCTAGSLDHTGTPVLGNARRYAAVFGQPTEGTNLNNTATP